MKIIYSFEYSLFLAKKNKNTFCSFSRSVMVCDISSKLCAAFTRLCRARTCWWRGSKSQSMGTLKNSTGL